MTKSEELRRWFYAVCWMGGAIASTLLAIWLVTLIVYRPWAAGTEQQRLIILGNALYIILVAGPALCMAGLAVRNAIRNIKASAGTNGATFEATAHEVSIKGEVTDAE